MKVAILGGGGCFALNFAHFLNSLGIDHFGIGRSPRKAPPFWQVQHHYRYYQAHLVTQQPAALAILDQERPDVIVNYAAQGEGAASFGDNAPDFFDTNCTALVRLVCALRKRNYLERFIQIGSSEVYGSPSEPAREFDPLFPTSPYSVSKAAFDQYLQSMHRFGGFPMNIVRPSNCYVEGQQLHRIIPKTMVMAMKGHKLQLHGGGMAEKSYLHADDLSVAVLRVAQQAKLGEVFNVGPDYPITIRALVQAIAETVGIDFHNLAEDAPDRVGQDSRYWLDCNAIKRLGWQPVVNLRDGLVSMYTWIKAYPELTSMPLEYQHRR